MKVQRKNIFKLIFIRHEKTYYKEIGHDLTQEGVERAKQIGKRLFDENIISKEHHIDFLHSPNARARGTLEFIQEGMGMKLPMKEVYEIRSSDYKDLKYFLQREKDLGLTLEDMAREHYLNEDFYNKSPHIIETNDSKRERLYIFLDNIIDEFLKKNFYYTPQIIAISHFEIIMHLIQDIFNIKTFKTYITPALGEFLILEAMSTGHHSKIRFNVWFRQKQKMVLFDRISKKIVKITLTQ